MAWLHRRLLGRVDGPRARRWGWRLARTVAGSARPPAIYYVTDGAEWSFDWDGRYITRAITDQFGQAAETIVRVPRLHGQIVHFGARHTFLHPSSRGLHFTNRIFLTWFHGGPDDAGMKPLFEALGPVAWEPERIVVPCALTRRALVAFGIDERRIVTIPLGVDLALFASARAGDKAAARRAIGVPDRAFVVGSFQKDGAGWGDGDDPKPEKGPDVLLDAVAGMARARKDLFVLLTGPSRGYVKKGLERIGVPYLHRMLDRYADVVRYYRAADACLIASRCEGGPKALLEAWAAGLPVVATRVGMVADLMVDGDNGILCEVEAATALADGTRRLAESPELGVRLAAGGRRTVAALDWWAIGRRYMSELYAPALADA